MGELRINNHFDHHQTILTKDLQFATIMLLNSGPVTWWIKKRFCLYFELGFCIVQEIKIRNKEVNPKISFELKF